MAPSKSPSAPAPEALGGLPLLPLREKGAGDSPPDEGFAPKGALFRLHFPRRSLEADIVMTYTPSPAGLAARPLIRPRSARPPSPRGRREARAVQDV